MFTITGLINGTSQKIEYFWEDGIGSYKGDILIEFKMKTALESHAPTGPVGQPLERDLDEPLSAFSMMMECFDTIEKIEGQVPQAAQLPDGVIG